MMKQNDLDLILADEREVEPSANFSASVMKAVRMASDTPPPIPFPWRHAAPGLCAAAIALVLVLYVSFSPAFAAEGASADHSKAVATGNLILRDWNAVGGNWMLIALFLSFTSVSLTTRAKNGSLSLR